MTSPDGAQITGESGQRYDEVLTAPASSLISIGPKTFAGWSRSRPARTDTRSWQPEARSTSCPRHRRSATPTGRLPHRRPAWSTVASRSPDRPTAR